VGLLWLLLLPLIAGYSAALSDRSPRVAALLADLAQYLSYLIIGLLFEAKPSIPLKRMRISESLTIDRGYRRLGSWLACL
jgi:hypothetical protein